MVFFKLFLPTLAFLMSVISITALYWIIKGSKESEFIPTYSFIGFSIGAVALISLSRMVKTLYGADLFDFVLLQDLLIAYVALFLFGALWQSYETELAVPPNFLEED